MLEQGCCKHLHPVCVHLTFFTIQNSKPFVDQHYQDLLSSEDKRFIRLTRRSAELLTLQLWRPKVV